MLLIVIRTLYILRAEDIYSMYISSTPVHQGKVLLIFKRTCLCCCMPLLCLKVCYYQK